MQTVFFENGTGCPTPNAQIVSSERTKMAVFFENGTGCPTPNAQIVSSERTKMASGYIILNLAVALCIHAQLSDLG